MSPLTTDAPTASLDAWQSVNIPTETIRRRHGRGWVNLQAAYIGIVDKWAIPRISPSNPDAPRQLHRPSSPKGAKYDSPGQRPGFQTSSA